MARKFEVKEAVKEQLYLKMALAGPSGSGKTYTALSILVNLLLELGIDQKPVLVDTERGSAKLFANDPWKFDHVQFDPPYVAEDLIDLLKDLVKSGHKAIIIDSATHFWNSEGGLIEMADTKANTKFRGNTFNAWSEVTPVYRKLMDTVLWMPAHTVFCMRSKQEYSQETYIDKNGRQKTSITKLGMAPEMRVGTEYELSIEGNLEMSHLMKIGKTRCHPLDGQEYLKPGNEFAKVIAKWLTSGAEVADKPEPTSPSRATANKIDVSVPDAPKADPEYIASVLSAIAIETDYEELVRIKDRAKEVLASDPKCLALMKRAYVSKAKELQAHTNGAAAPAEAVQEPAA